MSYYYRVNQHEQIGNRGRFEVGHYDPKGQWHIEHRYSDINQAAARVNYLNGGTGELQTRGTTAV